MTNAERTNELYTKYNLVPEDYFKSSQGWTILKRSGIDKIQAKANVQITYEVIEYTPSKSAAIKGIGKLGENVIESYGEAVYGKYPTGNTNTSYVLAMAEKRSMSRVVLKLTGFYETGHYGEDEGDFEETEKPHVPGNKFSKAMSAVMRGEYTAQEAIDMIEEHYVIGESQKHALKTVKVSDEKAD